MFVSFMSVTVFVKLCVKIMLCAPRVNTYQTVVGLIKVHATCFLDFT